VGNSHGLRIFHVSEQVILGRGERGVSNSYSHGVVIREGFNGTMKEKCSTGISVPMERSR
jgi:hypothetical protein